MRDKLEVVKAKIETNRDLNEEERSQTMKKIDEWILEDRADGTIVAELTEISKRVVPILEEVGLL
jgi:hypothetical protein